MAVFWGAGGGFDVEVLGEGVEQEGEVGAFEAVEFGFGKGEDFFGEGVGGLRVVGFGCVGGGCGGNAGVSPLRSAIGLRCFGRDDVVFVLCGCDGVVIVRSGCVGGWLGETQILRLRRRMTTHIGRRMTDCGGRWLVGGFVGVGVVFAVAGDVEGGELESVEEGSGAAAVDVVGGEVGDDGADGLLDGGAGGGRGQGEGVAAGVAGLGVGDGLALGVVVVAVVLGAEGVAAAAASVVEDVAAAEVVGDLAAEVGDGVEHGYPPPGGKCAKSFEQRS